MKTLMRLLGFALSALLLCVSQSAQAKQKKCKAKIEAFAEYLAEKNDRSWIRTDVEGRCGLAIVRAKIRNDVPKDVLVHMVTFMKREVTTKGQTMAFERTDVRIKNGMILLEPVTVMSCDVKKTFDFKTWRTAKRYVLAKKLLECTRDLDSLKKGALALDIRPPAGQGGGPIAVKTRSSVQEALEAYDKALECCDSTSGL